MTTKIVTNNSVYEVDEGRRMIRRVEGVNPPTAKFTPDGEWRAYDSIGNWFPGRKVVLWPDGSATTLSATVSEE